MRFMYRQRAVYTPRRPLIRHKMGETVAVVSLRTRMIERLITTRHYLMYRSSLLFPFFVHSRHFCKRRRVHIISRSDIPICVVGDGERSALRVLNVCET